MVTYSSLASLFLTSAIVVVPAGLAHAQDEIPYTLDPIILSVTGSPQSLREAPGSVSVVSGEDLRNRPVTDLADAVEGEPGVQVTGVGLGRQGISIRGMLPEQTLILVDGQRITNSASAVAHSDYELGWVPPEAIERIEIVRGPMSSLYGSDALGGVANIVTRAPAEEWRGSLSALGAFSPGEAGGDSRSFSAYASGPVLPGVLGLSLWVQDRQQDALASNFTPGATEANDVESQMAGGTLTWTPDDRQTVRFSFGAGEDRRWMDVANARAPGAYRSTDRIRRNRLSLSHEGDWDWGSTSVNLYRTELDRRNWRSDGVAPSGPHNLIDTVLTGRTRFSVGAAHHLTMGAELREEELEDPTVNAAGQDSKLHFATYLQDEITLGEGWSMILDARADHHEDFGWHVSPRAHLRYEASDALSLRVGVGTGFKAPTMKQLSPGYAAIAGGGRFTIVGNPNLKPEENVSFEAGLSYRRDDWGVDAAIFHNEVENLIQAVCVTNCTGAPGATWSYLNVDKARLQGLEIAGDTRISDTVSVNANYTYLDAIDRTTGAKLTGRSEHMAGVGIDWQFTSNTSASLDVHYVGAQPTSSGSGRQPAYTMVSVGGQHQFGNGVTALFGVENLTDKRLANDNTDYAFADPGRRAYFGIRKAF
ncbi:TonB-dependent receptor domain-containing protein [Roseovarius sp. MMSF_3281]|uniref:TonB-dependent receptor domain-containing protein n=1 Tax=Roseovarius sp. MMSF_3281 TaxID=3046694 RepID=UPI0027401312|nr:TonB-dependent receptor [Roseovarius sp. MMSF_3281]